MLNFADLLGETALDPDQSKYLARIRASTDRLHDIVVDTLEFVSAETGQTKLDLRSRKARSLFAQPSAPDGESIKALLSTRKLSLATDVQEAQVSVDEKAMRNVVRRLLHNAAKFADKGTEIVLAGRALDGPDSGLYRVSIRNEAPDIDKRKVKQMLKPFALNENALNHSTGTGMGLSICQSLLRLHGAALEVTSARGVVEASFLVSLS